MKKVFLGILCLFMITGCGKENISKPNNEKNNEGEKEIFETIERAREEATKNSAYGVVDAAKLYYTESLLDSTKTVKPTGNDATQLTVSGISITGGTWDFDSATGTITLQNVVIGDYTCTGAVSTMECTK